MARISFSYFVQDKLNPTTGQVIGHFMRPFIPIRLSFHHSNPSNAVNALVDSGCKYFLDKINYETDGN